MVHRGPATELLKSLPYLCQGEEVKSVESTPQSKNDSFEILTFILNLTLSPSNTNFQSRKRETRASKMNCAPNYIKLRYSLRLNYRPVPTVALRLEWNTNIEKGPIRVSRGYAGDSKVHHQGGPLMAPLLEQLSISRPPHIGC
ncbi:hypothetical protein CDAR_49641 [Caerostris darwini]|uniref:Uncharacterized protein n=1 Tax=Caerostris darwini TaxID=1538125 RepID=A0AAV4T792_9ARAC|nr:hypothetical protein CDAR_49641 [Caerostris darwini]